MIKLKTLLMELQNSNVGYHVGSGKSVSEPLSDAKMRAASQSKVGFLGTGLYFFGDTETAEDYRKFSNQRIDADNQLLQIDLSGYKLFRPKDAEEFVDALRITTINLHGLEAEELQQEIIEAAEDLKNMIPGKSEQQIQNILAKFAEDIKGSGDGVQLSNRLLDQFDGIDLRGTSKDHFGTGSIIFKDKIKPETFKPIAL